MYDTVIIGGGAAGLFTAANLKRGNNLLLEGTKKIGQKILISGGGMCNLTNMDYPQEFLKKFGGRDKINFLKPAILNFSTEATRKYFESLGMNLIIRDDGKVFPESLKAQTVINTLQREITLNGNRIFYNSKVTGIDLTESGFIVKSSSEEFKCRNLVITTGGKSYPGTGSDGSMYKILERLGCNIISPTPALVGIKVSDYKFRTVAGSGVKSSSVEFFRRGETKRYLKAEGDLLFTHQGLSGPVIMNNSREIEAGDILEISLIPCENREEKRASLLKTMNCSDKLTLKRFLKDSGLTSATADIVMAELNLNSNDKVKSLGKKVKSRIAVTLLSYRITVKEKTGFSGAMVTAGGVDIKEIDRKTMESKKIPGLYFAGEVIDIDGATGGYNFQAAFATARLITDILNQ